MTFVGIDGVFFSGVWLVCTTNEYIGVSHFYLLAPVRGCEAETKTTRDTAGREGDTVQETTPHPIRAAGRTCSQKDGDNSGR